jgi:hypothetical protein
MLKRIVRPLARRNHVWSELQNSALAVEYPTSLPMRCNDELSAIVLSFCYPKNA